MNLFNTCYSAVKELINKKSRELKLKANYKTALAKLEESKINIISRLEDIITDDFYDFEDIAKKYEELKVKELEIQNLKDAYEYVFVIEVKEQKAEGTVSITERTNKAAA